MSNYIGRFAPSPSGPLHLGSLLTAFLSYVHAQQRGGQWLLRIEDVDKPRTVAGADQQIIRSLRAHALHWDGNIIYQSERSTTYAHYLSRLAGKQYNCECSRASIQASGGIYTGICRNKSIPDSETAIRFLNLYGKADFSDLLQGKMTIDPRYVGEDFIIKRKDGLFAYNLAVVCDDIEQNITHLVRGADLIETTANQNALYAALGHEQPCYLHLPVLVTAPNVKLSKQNHAPAIQDDLATTNLVTILRCLNIPCPNSLLTVSPQTVVQWAIEHIEFNNLPQVREIIVPTD